jgi:hypothetical protein
VNHIGPQAAHEIADVADEVGADLIVVVGTGGYGPNAGLVLGSVTLRLLHVAACPVLAGASCRATRRRARRRCRARWELIAGRATAKSVPRSSPIGEGMSEPCPRALCASIERRSNDSDDPRDGRTRRSRRALGRDPSNAGHFAIGASEPAASRQPGRTKTNCHRPRFPLTLPGQKRDKTCDFPAYFT